MLGVQQYLPSASFAVLSGSRPARRFRSCGRYLAVILLCRYVFGFRSLDAASQSVFCHRFGIGGLVVFEFVPCHHIVGAQARTVFLCSVSSLSASGIPLPFQLGFPAFAPCNRHDGRVNMRCFLIQTQNCRYDVFLSEGLLQPAAGILGPSIQLPGLSDTLHIFGLPESLTCKSLLGSFQSCAPVRHCPAGAGSLRCGWQLLWEIRLTLGSGR